MLQSKHLHKQKEDWTVVSTSHCSGLEGLTALVCIKTVQHCCEPCCSIQVLQTLPSPSVFFSWNLAVITLYYNVLSCLFAVFLVHAGKNDRFSFLLFSVWFGLCSPLWPTVVCWNSVFLCLEGLLCPWSPQASRPPWQADPIKSQHREKACITSQA